MAVANRLAIYQLRSASLAPNYLALQFSSLVGSLLVSTIPISQSCIHLQLINFWPVSTTVLAQHFAIYLITVVRPFFSLFVFLGLKDCFYLLLTEEWVTILLLSCRCQGRFCLSHQPFSFTGWSGSTEPSGVCRSTIKHFILQALELFNAQGGLGKEID